MALYYKQRNLDNISKLADNTKAAALKWHDFLVKNDINILIYETIRTTEQQKANVAKGVSQTMKSYHLVGQALDFVPVDSKGNTLWNGYGDAKIKKAIAEAKRLGFEWGGDWKSFVDKPHLQFNYKGYGTDTFGKKTTSTPSQSKSYLLKGDKGDDVKALQTKLIKIGYKISADGIFGPATETAAKDFQKKQGIAVDGVAGKNTIAKLNAATAPKTPTKPTANSGIKAVGKIKIANLKNFTYIYEKPSDSSKKVGQANLNQTFSISGSVTGWYEVIHDGKRAYVKSKYAKRI